MISYVGRVSPPTIPVPPEGALYWDFVNGNLFGSKPGVGAWAPIGPPGSWNALPSGTNTAAQLVIGSGASLSFTGSGVINASTIDGVVVTGVPTPGEVITATSPTAANWQAAAGGLNYRTVRSVATSFTQGGVTIVSMPFVTPFADDNYTAEVSVVCEEAAPETPTVTQFPSAGVSFINRLTPAGTGVKVWVSNNDSGAHTGYVEVIAIHD